MGSLHSTSEEEEGIRDRHPRLCRDPDRQVRNGRSAGLLLTGLDEGSPAESEHCVVHLVSRSASDPDVVHVIEGWTSEEDHHRVFAGEAELHVWAGGFHGFDALYPQARISASARRTRTEWLARVLSPGTAA
ncbi:hypothetical protein [Microbispora rosea]|uniref:hypothetical protein n=1 Tax=Microbispora rosea TaxID=58117 RepID=UPI00341508C1